MLIVLILAASAGYAQGPLVSYLLASDTQLSWASCHVFLKGGSRHRIPFLPVVSYKRAPLGTAKYTRDVRIDAPLVFVGNGIVTEGGANAYGTLNVADQAVLLALDFPDGASSALQPQVSVPDRIRTAASRKAAAVVLFSMQEEPPFLFFSEKEMEGIPEIPVVTISRRSAEIILAAAGIGADQVFEKWRSQGNVAPESLIARLDLRIDGTFVTLDRPNFTFMFEKGIEAARTNELAAVNEESVRFVVDLFKDASVSWRKSFVTYFRDYDSKLFYTHHRGKGLASEAGVFNVFDPSTISLGLAVHENTHTLLSDEWGGSSSFLDEGLARYAEAMATAPDRDHQKTVEHIQASQLPSLGQLTGIDVGGDPQTEVAYPTAGSFVAYLITRYGLATVKRVYELETRDGDAKARASSWTTAFDKSLDLLEREWLNWLGQRKSGSPLLFAPIRSLGRSPTELEALPSPATRAALN